jgi:hypothetical protein
MNESDLDYLRNINTSPGPNAGKSIDPTKPGPDDALAQSDAEPVAWREIIKEAIDFIANEHRDPAYEHKGEWLPPKAKKIHAALVAIYTAPPRATSDPRYEISEVEGLFYVQRAGTDTVVAEFTDPPRPDANDRRIKELTKNLRLRIEELETKSNDASGLIEAAELAIEFSEEGRFTPHEKLTEGMTPLEAYELGISDAACWIAQDLRARAADRSAK